MSAHLKSKCCRVQPSTSTNLTFPNGLVRCHARNIRLLGQLKTDLSHSGTAVTNSRDRHQRSFSDRPCRRPLHYQGRVLANGWHQVLCEGPVSHGAKWHSRPVAVGHAYSANRSSHPPKPRYPVGWPCTRCDLKHMSKSHGWEVITEAQESLHRATVATSSAVRNRVAQRRVDAALPCPSPVNQ